MPLTIHHMGKSQSERIVWLVEELGIKCEYAFHKRDPVFSPQSIKDLHPAGTAPVMEDDPSPITGKKVVLAESGAIVEYIISVHGSGRFIPTPKDGEVYTRYLEWYHFSNATLQPNIGRLMLARRLASDPNHPYLNFVTGRWERSLGMLEENLHTTGAYLAGNDLTAADIMTIFTLTTMRGFCPVEFDPEKHKSILAYLKRVGGRPAYQQAMKICEGDDFDPVLGPKSDLFDLMKS